MGVGGAVLQGTMRNPLASPFTLGISQASALSVALVLIISSNLSFFLLQSPFILPCLNIFAYYRLLLLLKRNSSLLIYPMYNEL
jgi:iron complex transport system permease protein